MVTTSTANDKLETLAGADPSWLADLRRLAWERYQVLDFPQGREEHWRYTDLSLLDLDSYEIPSDKDEPEIGKLPAKASSALALKGTGSTGKIVHVDGSRFSSTLSREAESAGVILTDIETAAVEHKDLLRPRLGQLIGPKDVFSASNLALHRGGTFLYVPSGVRLSAPLQALHWLTLEGALVQPRTVVVVEPGAQVIFNDIYSSENLGRPSLVNPVTEVFIGREAEVGWVTWQDWGRGVRQISTVKAHLGANAKLNTLLVTLGGDYSRTWKECVMAGEGAESIMLGLYFSHLDQKFEHWTMQDHAAPHTRSDLLYKGALADRSRTVYYGTIRVRNEARKTDAYQANRNLTLSPQAKADTNPQLEIETNDVRCTHGATVGRVNDEHLFYLMSRGLSRSAAERLLIFGFFNEVLERVEWSGMKELLAEAIHNKLEGGK
ncbi:MAG: Fe-S cluster assembly protein SufD [Candidatus Glassbacteria bacterium RIFCSPLOWO2_12_FULL_58_11]|uniref:Fe-S cluster assembly protein SufD n=1 Tax=Candidatus Glassbacteria bacterium RIFCSPLOWO2_12_FULL_58_11 TaxID=1817867 RepID=A0A1F5YZA3_9BACT|nr:MAG: Fe-S cluster assembly protein SufD [Candidatus Glassbacteria bacterium RIFCSPLOWO2_12_FULL_58_11]